MQKAQVKKLSIPLLKQAMARLAMAARQLGYGFVTLNGLQWALPDLDK